MDVTFDLVEIDTVAARVWEEGKGHKVWAFYAGMGSGKTTFIHALCTLLKVKDGVSSPTYAIINEYKSETVGTICHMDWYRLKDEHEAINTGVEDAMENCDLCLIEWPEKAASLLDTGILKIYIEVVNATTRRLFTDTE